MFYFVSSFFSLVMKGNTRKRKFTGWAEQKKKAYKYSRKQTPTQHNELKLRKSDNWNEFASTVR